MTTQTVRRLYIYIAAFVGMLMLRAGLVNLLALLGERGLGGPTIGDPGVAALRLGGAAALATVGGPLWAGHWLLARRDLRQAEGQRSALRRLYAYALLLVTALSLMVAMQEALGDLLSGRAPALLAAPLAASLVNAAIWLAHWRIFAADRDLVERDGPGATLRRWYLALLRWSSLATLSVGAGVLIHSLTQRLIFGAVGDPRQLAMPAAAMVSGMLIWLPHELWSRALIRRQGPLRAGELGSTMRQVFGALVVVISLVAALTGLTALLAAAIRAGLGVAGWAEAFRAETRGLAALAVALPVWVYHRRQLALAAQMSGAGERMATARRLISYLIDGVGLAAIYFGLGGLLGTLLRLWLGGATSGAWRAPLSWYAALAIVALPVYGLASWRSERFAAANPDEERALSRRIYLYAALLFGVIASVITATQLVQQLVVALVGQGAAGAAGEIGRMLGYTLLGAAVAAEYGTLLARAGAARGTAGAGRTIVLVADAPLRHALTPALAHELPGAAIVGCGVADTPERLAALAGADLLISTLATMGDPTLAGFAGPRLLLATPVEGFALIGARRDYASIAREAARVARRLCAGPPSARPAPAPALRPHAAAGGRV